jgi:hypothetical protein
MPVVLPTSTPAPAMLSATTPRTSAPLSERSAAISPRGEPMAGSGAGAMTAGGDSGASGAAVSVGTSVTRNLRGSPSASLKACSIGEWPGALTLKRCGPGFSFSAVSPTEGASLPST